jgi:hypothetical protein
LLWSAVLGCGCAWCALGWAAERVVWDFRTAGSEWRPRAESVCVKRVEVPGPEGKNTAALSVVGAMAKHWNYACSQPVAIEPGKLYRLSAWVRVAHVGPGSPMPHLKCEFRAAGSRRSVGQVGTETYEAKRLGNWQELKAEFRVPATADSCWLALEKGTSGPAEIDACLANLRLERIARFSFFDTYRLQPWPPQLVALRGVHPRMYLDERRIAELRAAIKTTHAGLWRRVQTLADAAVRRGPPAYVLDDGHSGAEQLWQRGVGNTMPLLAMAYVLTGQRRYLDAARQWALAACAYKTWGQGRLDGMDLATGHQLLGLALVYDWCHRDLDEDARRQIRATLVRRAARIFEAAAGGGAWWSRSYLQNHLWVDVNGLAAAGFALYDEVDDAGCWIGLPLEKFRTTMAALGADGASHEGLGYWEYGAEYLLKFMDLARTRLGVDLYDCAWWRNTADYAQYLVLPRNAWQRGNCIVDIADCPRGHWYGPDYVLRHLAARFHDGHAQWLAEQLDAAGVCSHEAGWLNLVWFDPRQARTPPTDRPTLHHFSDMGLVSARSAWSGDESLLVFKCGPFIGHEAVAAFSYDPGGGHVHPDANHFVLFGAGEWLVRDDGYHPKWTGQHNTLLIDGRGQLGEGAEWFRGQEPLAVKSRPRITQVSSTPALDQIRGDASDAYPKALGLTRFVRHLLFLKPDVLIIADEIRLERAAKLELRFHPEQEPRRVGKALVARGKQAVLRVEPLTCDGVSVAAEPLPLPGRHGGKSPDLFTIRLSTERAVWRNAVACSWSSAAAEPPVVTLHSDGPEWVFQAGGRSVKLSVP